MLIFKKATIKKAIKTKKFWIFILFLSFIFLNNSSYITKERKGTPTLLAHRGLAQTFPLNGINNDTNTAGIIYTPEHPYLENTIPSMEAAFKNGADIVEFDVQHTKDNELVVFHDWPLEYRTNMTGHIMDYTLSELKKADIGYGYTADNGKTYPFRGKGIGLMTSIDDVINKFQDKSFLIHLKSDDKNDGILLAEKLSNLSNERKKRLAIYGGDNSVAAFRKKLPEIRSMSESTLKKSLITYLILGWTGYIPENCKNTELIIPEKYVPYLWGWPNKFLNRMDSVNTGVILMSTSDSVVSGFDSEDDLKRLPDKYTGGIWTNRIDKIRKIKH